ncbi:MAG: precorrin-6A reductase [Oscillospiraceae bacterium]
MYKLCVFAGTTEGRELVEFLTTQPVEVTACVATEYGETLLHPADNLTISARRLTQEEMEKLFAVQNFDCIIDATHPYAPAATENIAKACQTTGTEYMRLLREGSAAPADAVFVSDIPAAVEFLNGTDGNVLLTTGSKEIQLYSKIRDFAARTYARVLPLEDSLRACQSAGLAPSHILAMQGPFSREMNVAMLRAVSARYLVTKEAGSAGGFDEKIAAAREAGAALVVIGRPPQREGVGFSETVELLCQRFGLAWRPQVSVVGIGPGSSGGMTEETRRAIRQADCLIGAKRMLEAVAAPGQSVYHAIASAEIAEYIMSHRQYRKFTVVMSGDTGFFSGTKKLLPLLKDCQTEVLPGLSSLSCLCARLGTSYEDVVPVSVHGRDRDIVPDVQRNRRVFALVGGEDGMAALCRRLVQAGLGDVRVSVGERLGYADEKITVGTASELSAGSYQTLSVALIEHIKPFVVTHGLPDALFQRGSAADGAVVPMTKSEVRAVCLSKLRLTEDAVCWDVGAGTGSVAIEMALQARNGQVYAIERKADAVALMEENRQKLFARNMTIVSGSAPETCRDLPAPTHVFIGGSGGSMREIIALALEKNPSVRIVATAISLESVAELTAYLKESSFTDVEAVSLTVARDRKAGEYHLMTGQNPITIFTFQA